MERVPFTRAAVKTAGYRVHDRLWRVYPSYFTRVAYRLELTLVTAMTLMSFFAING